MKITILAPDLPRFEEALLRAPEILKQELILADQELLRAGIRYTVIAAPVDEGVLRASISFLEHAHWTGGGVSGSYGTNLLYAAQRNFGGPIFAKPGGWLVFEIDGKTIFAKRVDQKGSHYMEAGMDQVEPLVAVTFEKALERVFAQIGG